MQAQIRRSAERCMLFALRAMMKKALVIMVKITMRGLMEKQKEVMQTLFSATETLSIQIHTVSNSEELLCYRIITHIHGRKL